MNSQLGEPDERYRRFPASLVPVAALMRLPALAQKQPGADCTRQDKFPTSCNPFKAMHQQKIDNACGVSGDAQDEGDVAQDKAKNNLCASTDPAEIATDDLKKLQARVDDSGLVYGNRHNNPSLASAAGR